MSYDSSSPPPDPGEPHATSFRPAPYFISLATLPTTVNARRSALRALGLGRTGKPLIPRDCRAHDEPDRYIRTTKGGRYQARPYDQFAEGRGKRYNLGLFATRASARVAILEFWSGKRESIPRFTKRIHFRTGPAYIALVPRPDGVRPSLGLFATRDEAAAAARAFLVEHWGEQRAAEMVEAGS